jgi:hypothetical protein
MLSRPKYKLTVGRHRISGVGIYFVRAYPSYLISAAWVSSLPFGRLTIGCSGLLLNEYLSSLDSLLAYLVFGSLGILSAFWHAHRRMLRFAFLNQYLR